MALSATQYSTLKLTLRALLSGNTFSSAPNLGEADLLGFWNQLMSDSAAGVALSAPQNQSIDFAFRARLCGAVGRIPDADWTSFFTQLTTDSSGAASLAAGQYAALKRQLRAVMSAYSLTPGTVSEATLLGYLLPYAASSPASILGSAPAWWLDASAGTLTDAGGGAASQWADSSGNARNFTAAGAARPLIVASGLNSKTTCRFTTAQFMANAAYQSPTPATQFSYFFILFKPISFSANTTVLNHGLPAETVIYLDAAAHVVDYNGNSLNLSATFSTGTWYRLEVLRSNNAADYVVLNSVAGTPNAGGNITPGAGVTLNAKQDGTTGCNNEYAELFQWTGATPPTAPQRASLAAYSLAKWGI